MDITPETPTVSRKIANLTLNVPAPYSAGYVLVEGEAAQMNQVFAENISNNLRKKITDGNLSPEAAQALVDEYVKSYVPGVRKSSTGGGSRVTDPVERRARKIASERARELVISHGKKPKDVDMKAIAAAVFDKNVEKLMAIAKRQLEDEAKRAGDLDTGDLAF